MIFVGAVVSPEPIGGRSLLDGIDDPEVCREGEHFGFGEVRDGRKVHAAVPVFGVEPDPEVFDFVPRAGDKGAGALPQRVQCGHAQPGPRIRHGQAFAFVGAVGQGPRKRVVHLCQGNRGATHPGEPRTQRLNVFGGPIDLIWSLVDGHFHARGGGTRHRTQGGGHCRINASRNADHPTVHARLCQVVLEPSHDVLGYRVWGK